MVHCVFYQNGDRSITLLDIPGSIEVAQGFREEEAKRRFLCSQLIEQPYPPTEPKSAKAVAELGVSPIQDLLLQAHLHFALEEVKEAHGSPWCLPRTIQNDEPVDSIKRPAPGPPRKGVTFLPRSPTLADTTVQTTDYHSTKPNTLLTQGVNGIHYNTKNSTEKLESGFYGVTTHVPPQSTFILGNIEDTLPLFHYAPRFDIVIMDPPWPNRSARRKKSYGISYNTHGISALLSSIPLGNHLTDNGLFGTWITNKPAFRDLVLNPGGLFEQWGLLLIEEWIWLKVAASGQPICRLDSKWRKPYEILLLGRRASSNKESTEEIKRRVIVGVPDLHSQKPNLKMLLEPMLPCEYKALEIFARNLTAGWWAWGNEVLKFQGEEYWVEE
jgi:N6-adenosine-specific RNA methylase IME4